MANQTITIENSSRVILRLKPESIPDLNITVGPDLSSTFAHLTESSHIAITPVKDQKYGDHHSLSVSVLQPTNRDATQFDEVESAFLHFPATQYGTLISLIARAEERIKHQSNLPDKQEIREAIETIIAYGKIVGPSILFA